MAKEPSSLKKKIIFNKFLIKKLLYTSAFSWVYEGKNLIKNNPVAIKIEKIGNHDLLESEAYILTGIKGFGIPEIISFGKCGQFKILIEELLGKDLHVIWKSGPVKKDPFGKNNIFIKDICLVAIQGLERLKFIHEKSFIHRDIKPNNFLIGLNDPNVIYLTDFGFAKKYRSSRTGKHIKFSKPLYLYGSINFSSRNSMSGYENSRRDDLESFGYMLIYLSKGEWSPWTIYETLKNQDERIKNTTKMKLTITEENLCKGLPNEFIQYMKYVKKLDFEQEPNYQYLIGLFTSILSKIEMKKNLTFFWMKQKSQIKKNSNQKNLEKKQIILTQNKLSKTLDRDNSRTRTRGGLYNKIKNSLKKFSLGKNNLKNMYYNEINNKEENSLNIKPIENINNKTQQNRTILDIALSNREQNKTYDNLFQVVDINKNRMNTEMNDSNKKSLNNYISNNKKKKKPIKLINLTFNTSNNFYNTRNNFNNHNNINNINSDNNIIYNNNNISFYNNINYNKIYLIKKISDSRINKTIYDSKLNEKSKEKKFNIYKSINDLNLKRNIVYKPKFKQNLTMKNVINKLSFIAS